MDRRATYILRLDAVAGGIVGVGVLLLHGWLAQLYRFPEDLVLLIGLANVAYASYSGLLARRDARGTPPSRRAIDVLAIANLGWACVCTYLVIATHRYGSVFGLVSLVLEGIFVACLAAVEYRYVRPFTR